MSLLFEPLLVALRAFALGKVLFYCVKKYPTEGRECAQLITFRQRPKGDHLEVNAIIFLETGSCNFCLFILVLILK